MKNEWQVMGVSSLVISTMISQLDLGYEYKVMRRKVMTEAKEMKDEAKSIKIDKKYLSHSLLNFYRVGDNVSVNIAGATVTAIDGDEYTLDMPNAERAEFIEKCCDRCFGASSSDDYGRIYDEGARFK